VLTLCVIVLVLVDVDGAVPQALHSDHSPYIVLGSKVSVPTLQQSISCISVPVLEVEHGEANIIVITPFSLVELEAVGQVLVSV